MTHQLTQLLPHCEYTHFCEDCRDKERGRTFREGVLARQEIEDVDADFECPKKRKWGWTRPKKRQPKQTKQINVVSGDAPPPAARDLGPGDFLHQLIVEKYGIQPCQRCMEVIAHINAVGPDGCEQQRETIVADIWERRDMLKGWKAVAAKIAGKWEIGRLFDKAIALTRESIKDADQEKTTDADA